jgi:hypothetical protein
LKKYILIVLVILAAALALAGCGTSTGPDVPGSGLDDLPVIGLVDSPLSVDGFSDGYPAPPLQVAGAEIHLATDGNIIYVHARAEADGWIAVGFNVRGRGMDGSNMVIGFVDDNGDTIIRNDLGQRISHAPAALDGVIDGIVVLEGGTLTLEFSYPAVFPEENSFALDGISSGGAYSLIAAVHTRSANITQKHTSRGQADFRVD